MPTVIGLLVLYSLLPNWRMLFLSNLTKKKLKELMADRIAEIYFIVQVWRAHF